MTVPGYGGRESVELILSALDRDDPRPLWFCNWGTDEGSDASSLRLALDEVLRKRGPAEYARLKGRLRLSSDDQFGDHTSKIDPPFTLWVDTFRPELDRKRWYHRFSAITATAGGFDLERDVRSGHGPLGAMYPTNTTHRQKEGDTMTFLYLVPTGMNDPDQPIWGSWAGRYGPREQFPGKAYYWANQKDDWRGTSHRENTLARWAEHLQNDFRARLDWCMKPREAANHPPVVRLNGEPARRAKPGDVVRLDASTSTDPDGNPLAYEWVWYPEPGTYRGAPIELRDGDRASASFVAPRAAPGETIHLVLSATDGGAPPLTRYQRVVVTVE